MNIDEGWRLAGKQLSNHARAAFQAINDILYDEWDPIGVSPDAPRDEYSNYAPGIYELLVSGAAKEVICDRLEIIQTEYMGLPVDKCADSRVADLLLALGFSD